MWNKFKILQHQDVIKSILSNNTIPIHVEIEPTEVCNHSCVFCHWHGKLRKNSFPNFDFSGARVFPMKRLIRLISELKNIGTKAISFTGSGDPMMYKNMEQVLNNIIKKSMDFAVTSNFNMKLSESVVGLLKEACWLRCSLDAGSEATYKSIHNPRGKSPFLLTIDNLKKLVNTKGKARVNVSFVICDINKHEILKTTEIVKKIGVNSISFRPDTGFIRLAAKRSYDAKITEQLENAAKLETNDFKVYINYERLDETIRPDKDIYCYYSNNAVYIAANGDVYPCCMTRYNKKYVMGNILNMSFKEFWNSASRKSNYTKINMKFCPPCRHTEDNYFLRSIYGDENVTDNFI